MGQLLVIMDRRAGKTRTDPWSLLTHWQNLEFINGPAIWDQRDQGTWISSEVEILGTAPGWSLILIRIPRAGVVGKLGSGISNGLSPKVWSFGNTCPKICFNAGITGQDQGIGLQVNCKKVPTLIPDLCRSQSKKSRPPRRDLGSGVVTAGFKRL